MNSNNLNAAYNELESAKQQKNPELLESSFNKIYEIYQKKQSIDNIISLFQDTVPIFQLTHPPIFVAFKYMTLGNYLKIGGKYKEAKQNYHEAESRFKLLNNTLMQASIYMLLSKLHLRLGEYEISMDYAIQAVEIYESNKKLLEKKLNQRSKTDYGSTLETIAILFGKMKQKEKSRDYFKKANVLFKQTKFYQAEIQTLQNIGVSYSDEDPSITLQYYQKANYLAMETKFYNLQVAITNNIGGVYEDISKYDKALLYYKKALSLAEKHQVATFVPYIMKHIASAFYKMNQYSEALHYLKQNLEIVERKDMKDELQENYQLICDVYEAMQDYKLALHFFRKSSQIKDEIFNQKMIDKFGKLQQKYEETNLQLKQKQKDHSLISNAIRKSMNMQFIGRSKAITNVMELTMKAAMNKDINVLISGESGTGKEIIAHIIHFASLRKDNLFVPVNCCAIPESLMESEFFGYEKGAFTGAVTSKIGYLEEADKGSLFLDEIADMPLHLQSKLLRVLESRVIRRVGSKHDAKVDFRLISATNKNVSELIQKNEFRADLFYRINSFEIRIPPLRERKEDIEVLVDFFVKKFSESMKKNTPKIDKSVFELLTNYDFPGNVRELRNMIEKALIMLQSDLLTSDLFDIRSDNYDLSIPSIDSHLTLEEMERMMIIRALKSSKNNQTIAASQLGISYSTLYRKLKKYKIKS